MFKSVFSYYFDMNCKCFGWCYNYKWLSDFFMSKASKLTQIRQPPSDKKISQTVCHCVTYWCIYRENQSFTCQGPWGSLNPTAICNIQYSVSLYPEYLYLCGHLVVVFAHVLLFFVCWLSCSVTVETVDCYFVSVFLISLISLLNFFCVCFILFVSYIRTRDGSS